MLSEKHIEKLQELCRDRFGKEIGTEEAREKGMQLIRFLSIVLKPMTEEEFQELEKEMRIKGSNR